jgi:hypothetical protein
VFVHTGSDYHLFSHPVGTRDIFSRVKRPQREADNSPLLSTEVSTMPTVLNAFVMYLIAVVNQKISSTAYPISYTLSTSGEFVSKPS